MARYLVTGGAGFIGSNLVEELLQRGQQVRILDNFSTGRRVNLKPLEGQIELIEGDVRSYHIAREAVDGVDFVLHQAALPSVPRSVRDPITTNEVNITGTLNVLQAARDAGVQRLVFASSSSIYGLSEETPKRESLCPRPVSPYAISKYAAEQYCQAFWTLYGFETVCLRYFNVFGPRQDPGSQYSAVIPRFVMAAQAGVPLTIDGDGEQSRDFTYVSNVVDANLLACHAAAAKGRVMNVSCGQRHSLLNLVESLSSLLGRPLAVTHGAPRLGDVRHSQASIDLAREVLGYQPTVTFHEGLRRTVESLTGSARP